MKRLRIAVWVLVGLVPGLLVHAQAPDPTPGLARLLKPGQEVRLLDSAGGYVILIGPIAVPWITIDPLAAAQVEQQAAQPWTVIETTEGLVRFRSDSARMYVPIGSIRAVLRPVASLTGTVTLDGRPLAEGKLILHPAGDEPIELDIVDGAFSTEEAPVGIMRTGIRGEGVPARYHDETSGLVLEIMPGANMFDLDLLRD